MSDWFIKHRQGFIADMLSVYGQVHRGAIMEKFGVSLPQASADIAAFNKANPDVMTYDGRAKAYVVDKAKLPILKPVADTAEALRIRQLEHILEQIEVEAVGDGNMGFVIRLQKIVGLARRGREG